MRRLKSDEIWHIFRPRTQTFCSHTRTRQNIVILKKNLLSTDGCSTRVPCLVNFGLRTPRSKRHIIWCFFHSSSLVKFVTRYAIMFVRYKSTLGSINNFLLCVSRFGFSKSAFLNGSINMNKFFFRITIFCRVRA